LIIYRPTAQSTPQGWIEYYGKYARKIGYKIFKRYKDHGLEALTDWSRRPVRYVGDAEIQALCIPQDAGRTFS
jgi:hypothetical protein